MTPQQLAFSDIDDELAKIHFDCLEGEEKKRWYDACVFVNNLLLEKNEAILKSNEEYIELAKRMAGVSINFDVGDTDSSSPLIVKALEQ